MYLYNKFFFQFQKFQIFDNFFCLASEDIEDDAAAVVVEDRRTVPIPDQRRPLPPANKESAAAAAMPRPIKRFGYLAAAGDYQANPSSGYLADKRTGEPVPPPDPKYWAVYGGQP